MKHLQLIIEASDIITANARVIITANVIVENFNYIKEYHTF